MVPYAEIKHFWVDHGIRKIFIEVYRPRVKDPAESKDPAVRHLDLFSEVSRNQESMMLRTWKILLLIIFLTHSAWSDFSTPGCENLKPEEFKITFGL